MEPEKKLPEYSYTRRRGQPAVDPALRRIAVVAAVVSVAVILVALLWSGLRPRLGFGGAPEIAAPAVPLRVTPANPGRLTVPGANEQIMSGQGGDAAPRLAAPAAAPDVSQLQQAANAPAATAAKPAAVAGMPVAAKPVAAPAPPALAPTPPAAGGGPVAVQLAATGTEAAAHALWYDLLQKHPDLLVGKRPVFIPVTVHGKPVVRLRVPGFADHAAAAHFCAALAARGAGCAVAAF